MIIGIISGYFNPVHYGHIEYVKAAKEQCDHLIVIVNNDHQVKLKGTKQFMDEGHRCNIMLNIKGVDEVFLSEDSGSSVCDSIKLIRSEYPKQQIKLFNGGDRKNGNLDTSEIDLCKELDIEYVLINQPKIYSSSQLLSQ